MEIDISYILFIFASVIICPRLLYAPCCTFCCPCLQVCSHFSWIVRNLCDTELYMSSASRLVEHTQLMHEDETGKNSKTRAINYVY